MHVVTVAEYCGGKGEGYCRPARMLLDGFC